MEVGDMTDKWREGRDIPRSVKRWKESRKIPKYNLWI